MRKYLILDTETGGTNPMRHSLLDVGLAAYIDGEVADDTSFWMREDEYIVTGKAMDINGLDLSQVYLRGVSKVEAFTKITHFIKLHFGDERPMILGHNPSFDRNFLKYQIFLPLGQDIDKTIHYRTLDTMTLIQTARDVGLLPEDAPTSLIPFAKYIGYEPEGEHTALGDVYTTIAVHQYLLQLLGGN